MINMLIVTRKNIVKVVLPLFALLAVVFVPAVVRAATESGSIGISGTIPAPAPTVGATISIPTNGATVNQIPVQVSGICPDGLLVKLFKNDVFAGSVQCEGGSFSLSIDLFSGRNDLIARVFDDLDQPGPDSNTVNVTYVDNSSNPDVANRVLLISNYAKRGADPRQTLTWPIIVSGGFGPYAISIDWGDGNPSLQSVSFPGEFNIEHTYQNSGVYKVIVKAVDSKQTTAYLQLVAVANGPLSQTNTGGNTGGGEGGTGTNTATKSKTVILWQPAAVLIPFIATTFWLGKRYEIKHIRQNIEDGKRPF